jgi:hypothetical protein
LAEKLPRPVATLFKRFTELTGEEQLIAYETFRDYLVAGEHTVEVDPVLDERRQAIRVMRRVLDHYKRVEPRALTLKQFDDAPEDVREGWQSRRVTSAYGGSWKLARNELAGLRRKETAHQRAIRRHAALNKLKAEDYWTAIREWLATNPPKESSLHYDDWRKEKNASLIPSDLRAPSVGALRRSLHISWPDAVAIAKGKLTLEQAKRKRAKRHDATTRGGHDLVSRADIADMWGKAESSIAFESNKRGFPTAVLVVKKRRLYLRGDVAAFIAGKPAPKRTKNELQSLYLTHAEAADRAASRLGLASRTMWEKLPTPTVEAGGMQFWLTADLEAWLAKQARGSG